MWTALAALLALLAAPQPGVADDPPPRVLPCHCAQPWTEAAPRAAGPIR